MGRPSRAFQANYLAQGLIAKNTVMLTRKLIELAAGGDRAALKMCLDRVAPARRDPPVLFPTPAVETRRDVVSMLKAVANAVAMGDITPAQAATMIQMLDRVYCQL